MQIKPQEVQIGDVVSVFGRNGDLSAEPHWYNRKVTSDWIVNMEKHEAMLNNIRSHGVAIDGPQIGDTEPISLTEEILATNGFAKHDVYWLLKDNSGRNIARIRLEKGYESIEVAYHFSDFGGNSCEIRRNNYVHVLQQALRLLGHTEIANNFKI